MIIWPQLFRRGLRPRSFFRGRLRMHSRTSDRSPCCAAWRAHPFAAKVISALISLPAVSGWNRLRPSANSIDERGVLTRPVRDLVAHKREFLRIRRPRVHIDRALAAEDLAQYLNGHRLDLRSRQRHHAKRDFHLRIVSFGPFRERQKDHPLSIRRRMRKPVLQFVPRHLLRLLVGRARSVGWHPPD